jgi:uncharacterized protein (TIGR00369 family)
MPVKESFGRQSLMRTLGAELTRVAPGEVHVSIPFRNDLAQQSGLLHAGIVATIADTACGYAALSLMPDGSDVVSVEFKLNLLAPAAGGRFEARARVIRSGRTLSVCAADVFADDGTLVATMQGTFMRRQVP